MANLRGCECIYRFGEADTLTKVWFVSIPFLKILRQLVKIEFEVRWAWIIEAV